MADENGSPMVWLKLLEVQKVLKVEKANFNSFGKYRYRSKEDILEAAKPLCHERGLVLLCTDGVRVVADGWVYVETVASVVDVETGERVQAVGLAREPLEKKGMDASQITGTASSYAGKRALGNLLAIDDTKDTDALPQSVPKAKEPPAQGPFTARCECCGTRYQFQSAEHYRQFVPTAACCPTPRWVVE